MKNYQGVDKNIIHKLIDRLIGQYKYFYNFSKDRTDLTYNEVKKEDLDDILSSYNMKLSLTEDSDEKRRIQGELNKFLYQRISLELENSKDKYIYIGLVQLVTSLIDSNLSTKITSLLTAKEDFEKSRNEEIIKKYDFVLRLILLIISALSKQRFTVFDLTYDLINSFNELDNQKIIEYSKRSIPDIEFINSIISRIISFIIEENRTYHLESRSPERFNDIIKNKTQQVRKVLEALTIDKIYTEIEEEIRDLKDNEY